MSEAKVSIVMAAYNAAEFIEDAINSIKNQSYRNWELIVCDDNSSDHTLKILKSYEVEDDRIKILHNDINMKQSATRNNCIEKATGEYIMVHDSDDIMEIDKIKNQVRFLHENESIDFVCCDSYIFNSNGRKGAFHRNSFPSSKEVIRNKAFTYCTMLAKSSCIREVGGYTVSDITKTGEDYDLICKMYMSGYTGANITEVLHGYRVNDDSYKRRKYKCYIDETKVFFKFLKQGWFKNFDIPYYNMVYLIAPLLKGLVPWKIVQIFHNNKFK
ncbi:MULTISPECIES: glycosyltransferase family 2 protein [unclassified Breznakia]|uniref:glycosyltransferase family 2 protein n=1 Tax=unclassified Breznakia TaxID=2623764 RepID=UPI00247448D3|nr:MULTISPECIES: glycosyltransferase family 2 protein [unclassified Breznakia]MDH6366292.1 glycosyltransferase EpsE [Breznakia sp. PH1-1]MDH6403385.1 glycosyltransferase EpsE [Breznakia sp. PF1-11]MDH6411094.1 glycosyltransferase EpsE [Breznakia sp. PFB1-11]MDH6413458.1 glycosyltransferase EpsE [Breznakia sp. PFB1-14]MDH6416753.1 glycosyltransferase EpsE [Breznakia sp. PFB1-4]